VAVAVLGGGCAPGGVQGVEGKRTSGLLAAGTQWANPYYIVDSGAPGPTLLVTGGVHGNEPAGYRAAEQIRHWSIERGRLIVLPRINVSGIESNSRWISGEDKSTRNVNRNFPKSGQPNQAVMDAPTRELHK